jgi:hypothetical protein
MHSINDNSNRQLQQTARAAGTLGGRAQKTEAQFQVQVISNTTQLATASMPNTTITSILGSMHKACGACLAKVPDLILWNTDTANPSFQNLDTTTDGMGHACSYYAAIVDQRGGLARELADALSWQELTQGGAVGGQQLDPDTFLPTQLAAHYTPHGKEQRRSGVADLMTFHRQSNEQTDAPVARYRTLHWRVAQGGGGMLVNWEGYSWLLLRAYGVNSTQWLQLLQPYQGRFPNTQQEFKDMQSAIHRMTRNLEGQQGNLASSL